MNDLQLNEFVDQTKQDYVNTINLIKKEQTKDKKEVNPNAYDEIKRILSLKDDNSFKILNIPEDSTDPEVRSKFKLLSRLVFPDKNTHEDAGYVFDSKNL